MAGSLATEELGTSRFAPKTVNPSSADIDIVATYGRSARWMVVVDDVGTIAATFADGTDETLPAMPKGHPHMAEVTHLKDTSTCTSVTLFF